MRRVVSIAEHERGIAFRDGRYQRFLEPGRHVIWNPPWREARRRIEVQDITRSRFEHPLIDLLVTKDDLLQSLEVVELGDEDRALVWRDERLVHILGPGRHALWSVMSRPRIERFSIREPRFEHERLETILDHPDAGRWLDRFDVGAHLETLLFRRGELFEVLAPGRHAYWRGAGPFEAKTADRRETTLDIAGQEIMTRDKVTLRVNLLVTFRVADFLRAVTSVTDYTHALYRDAQLALRAVVGTRSLDALLADKESLGSVVRSDIEEAAAARGLEIVQVGLRDIILPGDMKEILSRVIAAEKEAQANLIRRREETAAARSQANTARLLAENPHLARMKELEAVAEILSGSNVHLVFGSDNLASELRGLVGERPVS